MVTGTINNQQCNVLSIKNDGINFWTVYVDESNNIRLKRDFQTIQSITSATATPSGSSSVLWGNLPTGTSGDIKVVDVDGELCIAKRTAVSWELTEPSVAAYAYVSTNPMPPGALTAVSYSVIQQGLDYSNMNVSQRTYQLQFVNKTGYPVRAVYVGGQGAQFTHAAIQGAKIQVGNSDQWTPITVGSNTTWTPGFSTGPANRLYWYSDRIVLPTSIPNNGTATIRIMCAAGAISESEFYADARANFQDVTQSGYVNGDYLSDPSTNPGSWTVAGNLVRCVVLETLQAAKPKMAAWFGDSLVAGYGEGGSRDKLYYVANTGMTGKNIVGFGDGGQSVETMCDTATTWLATSEASLYDTVAVIGWSFNDEWANAGPGMAAKVNSLAASVSAAGKRFVVVFHSPPGVYRNSVDYLSAYEYVKANASNQGYNVIDMSSYLSPDGILWTPEYTIDNIHASLAGQTVQGNRFIADQNILFG
jgi:hypothetical protein